MAEWSQRIANPSTPVRFRLQPPKELVGEDDEKENYWNNRKRFVGGRAVAQASQAVMMQKFLYMIRILSNVKIFERSC